MKKLDWIVCAAALVILTGLLSACSLAADVTPPPGYQSPTAAPTSAVAVSYPAAQPDLTNGAALYAEKCEPCHGAKGLGDGPRASQIQNTVPPIGAADVARGSTPADWFQVVSIGRLDKLMPGFSGSLSAQQIWDVLAYVYALSEPADAISTGKALYTQNCVSCHAADGQGSPTANLANATWQGTVKADSLFETISLGISGKMPGYASKLSENERWSLVSYVRSLASLHGNEMLAAAATTQGTTTPPAGGATPGATVESGTAQATASVIGSISGKITNGSGGPVPGGLEVTLHGYDNMDETVTRTTQAGEDGSYNFSDVEMPANRVFMTSVVYKDTTFNSEIMHQQEGNGTAIDLPLTIYETTTDASAISLDRMHVFFDFSKPDTVQVVELFVISNNGLQTVVSPGSGKPVLTFVLPKGATNLQFEQGEMGQRYVSTPDGFGDTQSIPPGVSNSQLLFAFDMAYSKKMDLSLPVTRPVQSAVIMVPKDGVTATGSMLTDGGERDVQGMTFHLYNAENLVPDKPLTLTISGTPNGGTQGLLSGGTSTEMLVGISVFALALIGLGLWVYRQRRLTLAKARVEVFDADRVVESSSEPDTLIDAIIALDDMYQAGKLTEEAYQQRRAELKDHLAELMAKE